MKTHNGSKLEPLGINALTYTSSRAGISNYIYHLIEEHHRFLGPKPNILLYIPKGTAKDFMQFTDQISIREIRTNGLISRILAEQILLPYFALRDRISSMHSMANVAPTLNTVPNIVTIHDVYYLHDPHRFGRLKNLYLKTFVKLTTMRSAQIICVSKTTENDLHKYYPCSRKKTTVIYEGASKTTTAALLPYTKREPFFLFVGTIEPGKNLSNLIRALSIIDKEYHLKIVGKWGWGCEDLKSLTIELGVASRVEFSGYVADPELENLYRTASATILPSFHEGFGLPIIEAQLRGCAVCCSNTSCMPEIAGDGALFFTPLDPKSIADALAHMINPKIRNELIEKGFVNVKRFSWENCLKETMGIWSHVAASARSNPT